MKTFRNEVQLRQRAGPPAITHNKSKEEGRIHFFSLSSTNNQSIPPQANGWNWFWLSWLLVFSLIEERRQAAAHCSRREKKRKQQTAPFNQKLSVFSFISLPLGRGAPPFRSFSKATLRHSTNQFNKLIDSFELPLLCFISLHSLCFVFFLHWFHCWFLVWFSSLGGAIGAASAHNPPIKDKPKPTFINCGSSRALLKFHSSISNAAWGRSARQLFLYFFFQLIRKSWKEKK